MTPVPWAEAWRGHARCVALATRFANGADFLAAWSAWQADPQRCESLHFIAIEAEPPSRCALAGVPRPAALSALADKLVQAWPPLTPNLHTLSFENEKVRLALAVGKAEQWLPGLVAQVDIFVLDDTTISSPRLFKALARLAAPGAKLWSAIHSPADRRALAAAGFRLDPSPAADGAPGMSQAIFSPAFVPRASPRRPLAAGSADRHAVIVGGGLAGCAAAWALAEQGWRSTVIDRHPTPAAEASGNPAGLFHGIVNPQDGTHARLYRAAALDARVAVGVAIDHHGVAGSTLGLLRQESRLDLEAMRATLARLRLPPDYVSAVGAREAEALCGLPQRHPAWFYPGGGWVDPAGLARSFLARAGSGTRFCGDSGVSRLHRNGAHWELLDAQGAVIEAATTVVLANSTDALRLAAVDGWPIEVVRGQISWLDLQIEPSALPLPRIALAGAGYLLPAAGGRAIFGATSRPGDSDASVRLGDHAENLAQLANLLGHTVEIDPARLQGRTGWRCVSRDRLPLIGAMPTHCTGADAATRLDRPSFVPRRPGLFVFTALGSRGITWSALGARVLASAVCGSPAPVEASLLDALDPARFVSRAARRARALPAA